MPSQVQQILVLVTEWIMTMWLCTYGRGNDRWDGGKGENTTEKEKEMKGKRIKDEGDYEIGKGRKEGF